ncbi:hypothetical protein HZA86_02830 [Candidatus Uhrbacteria bacterium]|nr:hypothetical protein [Candidatus Uhrbacteria bacterium]
MPRPFAVADAMLVTLQYFALRHCPLTESELLQFLPADCSSVARESFDGALDALVRKGAIESTNGFYGLPGALPQDLKYRADLYCASLTKWRIAHQSIVKLSWIPFLRMVAVTNTLALNMAEDSSDIDVLVVGSSGRLWTVRWLVTAVLQLSGRRRHGHHIKNRICLSFYLSDQALNFGQFFHSNNDLHYAYWVGMIVPMFVANGHQTQEKFFQENSWINEFFPQHHWIGIAPVFEVRDASWAMRTRSTFEWFLRGRLGNVFETAVRWIQRKKIYSHQESRVHQKGVDVVVTDDVLKFHESDSRAEHRKQWREQCRFHGIEVDNTGG